MNNLTAWQGSNSREAIRDISFSPDDQRFATASDDSSIRIWSFAESRVESVLTGTLSSQNSVFSYRSSSGHGWDVKCAQWHPTKGLIVSGSKDNLIKFWDPRTGTCLSTLSVTSHVAEFSCQPNRLYQTSSQKYDSSSFMVHKWQPCGQCIARSKRPCL